jgi:hypothetical protein
MMESNNLRPTAGRYDRRQFMRGLGIGLAGLTLAGSANLIQHNVVAGQSPDNAQPLDAPFNFETGNAIFEVFALYVPPIMFQTVSPSAMDATLVLRITTLIANGWYDAIARYHPTAVGVYSRIPNRPASEATNANRNVAILYASYHLLNSLMPRNYADWRAMLESVGLNPDDGSEDPTTAIGIGNLAGKGVIAARERDGMNQLGDEGGQLYHRRPYADYTGYQPVNTAYELRQPGRWQPDIVTTGNGIFRVQQFVTPQIGEMTPYSLPNLNQFKVQPPVKSNPKHPGYREQVNEVLAASAALTDHQKMMAELYDNKLLSLGVASAFVVISRQMTIEETVIYDFLTNLAALDTAIVVWREKRRHDAVRPFSAVRHVYGNQPITAWGGPGKGTVSDLPANQWRSYLDTADHPEYPSGSASFCAAHAEASRLYLGSDDFGWSVPTPAGSSRIEPGITPAEDIVLGPWATWTDFENECAMTRVWAGVHFKSSLPAGQELGHQVGRHAYEFIRAHVDGTAD